MARKKLLKDPPIVCKECGSTNVEIRLWVNPNTGEQSGETGEDEDTWCKDCQKHCGVKN